MGTPRSDHQDFLLFFDHQYLWKESINVLETLQFIVLFKCGHAWLNTPKHAYNYYIMCGQAFPVTPKLS